MTLGGTGKDHGDRHPKISDNVLIGACATVLGNICVGEGAQIAAGSLVLKPVTPHTMVAGSPAKVVGHVTGVWSGDEACVAVHQRGHAWRNGRYAEAVCCVRGCAARHLVQLRTLRMLMY